MYRTLLCLFTILALTRFSASGQTTEEKPLKTIHEIGLNFTFMLDQLINFGSEGNPITSPYVFTYKQIKKKSATKSKAFRMALGLRLEDVTDENNFVGLQDFRVKESEFAIRIGGETQYKIMERWQISSGFDFLVELNGTTLYAGDNLDEEFASRVNTKVGFGPALDIQFFINKHISLSTESNLYFAYNNLKNTNSFSGGGDNDQKVQSMELILRIPTSLYFNIRF